jgi:metal-dependent hydrolase (beta-lactamase superfamily II)
LISADSAYLQHVVTVLRNEHGLLDFYLNHCTGEQAFLALARAFGHQTHSCPAGAVLTFD